MKLKQILICVLIHVAVALPRGAAHAEPLKGGHYSEKAEILFGGLGGWDDLSVDPESHRLYLSHSDRVVVLDTEKNKVIKEILDTPGVHGIALALDLKKGFSSNGKEGKVSVIDLSTLVTKSKIKVGDNPDAIVYEPNRHEVYVFNGKGNSVSILDARTEQVSRTLALPGKPEFAVADSESHRIFVNIEDKNSITAIDTQSQKVAATWRLEGCESPTGIAMDRKNHRLFSVCENEKMVMVDSLTGRVVASVPIGKGADGAGFDPGLLLAFSSNGRSGSVTIAREETPEKLGVVESLKTRLGARTMTLNPLNHRIYLPTADFLPSQGLARPKPVDGTQTVLVYGGSP